MSIYGVKATEPGLVCRGYQFKPYPEVNKCDHANCARNGFHFAENPLDCLYYYGDMEEAEYWLVRGDGDVDEDDCDSKVTCTEITFVKKLDRVGFAAQAARYIMCHPKRPLHGLVCTGRGIACKSDPSHKHFVIVVGDDPLAMGECDGDVLLMMRRYKDGRTGNDGFVVNMQIVGQDGTKPCVWYDINGREREVRRQ